MCEKCRSRRLSSVDFAHFAFGRCEVSNICQDAVNLIEVLSSPYR
jgi:hypothetical protein